MLASYTVSRGAGQLAGVISFAPTTGWRDLICPLADPDASMKHVTANLEIDRVNGISGMNGSSPK